MSGTVLELEFRNFISGNFRTGRRKRLIQREKPRLRLVKTLAGSNLAIPPGNHEVEVSIFGPGLGESIVVHLTNGEWIVVDSCLETKSGEPMALRYFRAIKVNPSDQVKFVIATHWHDDHIGGLAKLFEECKTAKFVCAAGLKHVDFLSLLTLYKRFTPIGGSNTSEFEKILSIIKSRRTPRSLVAPEFAQAGMILYERGSEVEVYIKALSPSSAAVAASMTKIAEKLMPTKDSKRSPAPFLRPNDLAIVLTLGIGGSRILLGADLEDDGRAGVGWREIVIRFAGIENGHQGFKIPHHGSANGHNLDVWSKMIASNAWAVITPFDLGKRPLPDETDIERICSLTSFVYLTARKTSKPYRHPDTTVQNLLRESNITIVEEFPQQGHVRLRRDVTDATNTWCAELFGDACQLVRARTS